MSTILFHFADVKSTLKDRNRLRDWIVLIAKKEKHNVGDLSFIFCSDEYLLQMNRDHLQHDYYTDVITFDYSEGKTIAGEIYISIDRIKDNAKTLGIPTTQELHRVMIHGVLHLLGYKDKSPKSKKEMTAKEDWALGIIKMS